MMGGNVEYKRRCTHEVCNLQVSDVVLRKDGTGTVYLKNMCLNVNHFLKEIASDISSYHIQNRTIADYESRHLSFKWSMTVPSSL